MSIQDSNAIDVGLARNRVETFQRNVCTVLGQLILKVLHWFEGAVSFGSDRASTVWEAMISFYICKPQNFGG